MAPAVWQHRRFGATPSEDAGYQREAGRPDLLRRRLSKIESQPNNASRNDVIFLLKMHATTLMDARIVIYFQYLTLLIDNQTISA